MTFYTEMRFVSCVDEYMVRKMAFLCEQLPTRLTAMEPSCRVGERMPRKFDMLMIFDWFQCITAFLQCC